MKIIRIFKFQINAIKVAVDQVFPILIITKFLIKTINKLNLLSVEQKMVISKFYNTRYFMYHGNDKKQIYY